MCPFIGAALVGAADGRILLSREYCSCPFIGAALVGAARLPAAARTHGAGVHSSGPRWLVRPRQHAGFPVRSRVSIHRGRVGWCGSAILNSLLRIANVSIHRGRVGWCGEVSEVISKCVLKCPFIGAALVGAAKDRCYLHNRSGGVHSSGPRWLVRPKIDATSTIVAEVSIHRGRVGRCGAIKSTHG